MSCDHRFTTFITTAAQAPAIAQTLGGDPATAAAVLSELFEVTREQASAPHGRLAELRAQAGCTALFERMGRAGVTPPAHGEPSPGMGFPLPADGATRHAFAAVEVAIAAAEAGEPLPSKVREIMTAVALRADRPAPPPVRRFDRLYHIGRLDAAAKTGDSYEGDGLSVSLHPEDWRRIARLGDAPVWAVDTRSARLLDFHAFRRDKATMAAAYSWVEQERYVERGPVYVVTVPGEESGRSLVFRFLDADEARQEARSYLEMDIDDDDALNAAVERAVRRRTGYIPTARLAERMRHARGVPLVLTEDLVAVAYAEDVLKLDGVWWDDYYDPDGYSAPRGVLFADRLPTLAIVLVQDVDADR